MAFTEKMKILGLHRKPQIVTVVVLQWSTSHHICGMTKLGTHLNSMAIVLYCEKLLAAIFDGDSNLCGPCEMPMLTEDQLCAVLTSRMRSVQTSHAYLHRERCPRALSQRLQASV